MSPDTTTTVACYCPHCDATLPPDWTEERAGRCPTCRLVIGAGRATARQGSGITLSGAGTAAGILSSAARRADAEAGDPGAIAAAMRGAAVTLGVESGRLRMVDYQQLSEQDPAVPDLSVVLATFGTWKVARARAQAAPAPAVPDAARAAAG